MSFIGSSEVARRLGVGQSAVRRMADRGEIEVASTVQRAGRDGAFEARLYDEVEVERVRVAREKRRASRG